MGLLERLFKPKIEKLRDRGDGAGLHTILASDAKTEHRVTAIEALVEMAGPDLAEVLVSRLGDQDPAVDGAAEKALRQLGASALEALTASLTSPVGDRTLDMVLELGDSGADSLRDASQSLEASGRRRALQGLLEIAQATSDDDIREISFRSLLAAVGDRSAECRSEAADGLNLFRDPRAARALAAQLKDGNEAVRQSCHTTLEGIGAAAIPDLTAALMERNPNSRLLAAELLGGVWSESVDLQDREAAVRTLLGLVDDRDDRVRQAVTTSLGRISVSEMVEAHLERIEDPTSFEREESAELIRQLLEHGAVEPVRRDAALERLSRLMPEVI